MKKKRQVDEKTTKQLEFEVNSNNEEYKLENICNNTVYIIESEASPLSGL